MVHVPEVAELPCCAAAMLTRTQTLKSRARLPLQHMMRHMILLQPMRLYFWTRAALLQPLSLGS